MKTKLFALAGLLCVAAAALAQDATSLATDTQLLKDETAYLQARLAKLKAEAELQTQVDSAATAAKAEKDQARRDTLKALDDLAAKMPAGAYTATADGVATPKAMELAFRNLESATDRLYGKISSDLAGKTVVLVESIPDTKPGFELFFYQNLIAEIERESGIKIKHDDTHTTQGTKETWDANKEMFVPAAAAISALPSIVNVIGGLFRADYTERVFEAKLSSGQAVSVLLGRLQSGPAAVHLGLESYAFARLGSLAEAPIAVKIGSLRALDERLEAEAKDINTKPEEKSVVDATNAVAATKAKAAQLEHHRDLLAELVLAAPQTAGEYEPRIRQLGQDMLACGTALAEQNAALAAAKATLAQKSVRKNKITEVRDRIAKLFTDLRSQEGTPPLFARLVRDELLQTMTADPDDVRFVSLNLAASPQGTVTKKTFWGQSAKASSLVALEYRIADGRSKITAAGIIPYYSFEDAKLTEARPESR